MLAFSLNLHWSMLYPAYVQAAWPWGQATTSDTKDALRPLLFSPALWLPVEGEPCNISCHISALTDL